jgi:hypothetical protein
MVISAAAWLHSAGKIEAYVNEHPEATLENVLAQLAPEIRSNFTLVYRSRSQIEGTLQKPRVILFNKDASLMISYAGSSDMRGGNQLELIERNMDSGELKFKQVDFQKAPKERFEHQPKSCVGCHSTKGSDLGLRYIWDTYPDWPGFYGSSHAGTIKKTSKGNVELVGTSTLPIFDFERNGFDEFKSSQSTNPRYSALIGLESKTVEDLAETNTRLTEIIARSNYQRILNRIKSKNYSLEDYIELNRAIQIPPSDAPRIKDTDKAIADYVQAKKDRIKANIQDFGTPYDKVRTTYGIATINDNSLEARQLGSTDLRNSIGISNVDFGKRNYFYQLGQVLKNRFQINPEDLSFTRELNTLSLNSGFLDASTPKNVIGAEVHQLAVHAYQGRVASSKNDQQLIETLRLGEEIPELPASATWDFISPALKAWAYSPAGTDLLIQDPRIAGSVKDSLAEHALETERLPIERISLILNTQEIDPKIRGRALEKALQDFNDLSILKGLRFPNFKMSESSAKTLFYRRIAELAKKDHSPVSCLLYQVRAVVGR